ncbi:hypothetical protein RN001_002096 [Aquatica leii]|uniref:Uncharacterized protein n=1 Tax=Aquatica leii TaxID=1421715 RepID=A0AAN7SSS1_9COLE|nr:hypothetical protein RN001_002096 [Aquatica leii]
MTEFLASSECFNAAETIGVKLHKENYGDSAIGYVELKREGSLCHVEGRVCPDTEYVQRQRNYKNRP